MVSYIEQSITTVKERQNTVNKYLDTFTVSSYRSGTVNSNTVNSKFHLIRSFFETLARILSFHV